MFVSSRHIANKTTGLSDNMTHDAVHGISQPSIYAFHVLIASHSTLS